MAESRLRTLSIDFAVHILNLVKFLKSQHETIVSCWLFKNFTRLSICTAKSMDSVRNLLSAIILNSFIVEII